MKFALSGWLLIAGASALFAAQPLFNSPAESKWSVHRGSSSIGTITLLTGRSGTRAEFRSPSGTVTTFLGANGTAWQRTGSGDVEVSTLKPLTVEAILASALLYKEPAAKYATDAKGPSKVDVTANGQAYTLTRTSLASSSADASTFAVRPKKSASSRLARLSGDLLGPSNTSVSATAGGRGAGTKGLTLKDGGDYAAVKNLENRDAVWKEKLDNALADFQKSGNVGKAREAQ